MQEHSQLTQKEINRDLLSGIFDAPKWWLPAVIFLTIVFLIGASAFGFMLNKGVGVTGLNRPAMWGFSWSTLCSGLVLAMLVS